MQIFDTSGPRQTVRAALLILFMLFAAAQVGAGQPAARADAAIECEDAPAPLLRQPPVDPATWGRIMAQVRKERSLVPAPHTVAPSIARGTSKLTASDGASGDSFGASVAMDGDTIVVGAPLGDVGDNLDQGSAHVFERNHGGPDAWGQVQKLIAGDGGPNDQFGFSVAIHGDTIVVGASENTVGDATAQGSAYVFERDQGGANAWGQTAQLIAADGAACDRFGVSAAVHGDTIAVGAYFDGVNDNPFQGSAYLFERNRGGVDHWGQLKRLAAPDGQPDDAFGVSLALDGDTLVVGAALDDVGLLDEGSAYIFERNRDGENAWGQVARLVAGDGAANDNFGLAVDISGDKIVVGAPYDDSAEKSDQGSAYLFERNRGGPDAWGQVRQLMAADGASDDSFGVSVAVDGDAIVVGAYLDNVDASADQGAVYAFGRDQGGANAWGLLSKYTADEASAGDHLGVAVAVNDETIVAGADAAEIGDATKQGAAFVFTVQVGRADLALDKNVVPQFGVAGSVITYTLSFTNVGAGYAAGVTLGDHLPPGMVVDNVTSVVVGSGVVITPGVSAPALEWAVSDLAPGAGGVISIRARTDPELAVSSALTNRGMITATNDTLPANNASNATFTVVAPVYPVYLPVVVR